LLIVNKLIGVAIFQPLTHFSPLSSVVLTKEDLTLPSFSPLRDVIFIITSLQPLKWLPIAFLSLRDAFSVKSVLLQDSLLLIRYSTFSLHYPAPNFTHPLQSSRFVPQSLRHPLSFFTQHREPSTQDREQSTPARPSDRFIRAGTTAPFIRAGSTQHQNSSRFFSADWRLRTLILVTRNPCLQAQSAISHPQ